MSSSLQAWNGWWGLSFQAARLGWEAQSVIALRMMRLATQSPGRQTEARRMGDRESGGPRRSSGYRCRRGNKGRQCPSCREEGLRRLREAGSSQPTAAKEGVISIAAANPCCSPNAS
jgi:hypothetical protein